MLQTGHNFPSLMVREKDGGYRRASGEEIIEAAISEVTLRFSRGTEITSPDKTKEFLQLKLGHLEHEVFAVLWLDNRHRVIAFSELFHGTIDGTNVHPREVVKMAMQQNAAACIFAHNHPSGMAEPSPADQHLTQKLKEILSLVGVKTLDHVIVGENTYSFAERGLM